MGFTCFGTSATVPTLSDLPSPVDPPLVAVPQADAVPMEVGRWLQRFGFKDELGFFMTFTVVACSVFFVAMIATALTVFPFRALAGKVGMVDHPDNFRKLHSKPVPVGGGVVIFLVLTSITCLLVLYRDRIGFHLALSPKLLLPLIIVSPFIVLIGLIDDKRGMSGKMKLLCQVIAASIIIGFAKYYSEVTYFGIELNLHHLFYPIAVFWIIGMINAINLLDGADGVAVTASFYMSLATACTGYINGHPGIALIALGLAGCLLGFFVHNRPPARIYLGDTGSMFIGLVLGTLILRASAEADRTISVCGPLAIVLIPMVDSFFAVIRRVNSGRTIFSPDRGHLHHLLSLKVSSPYGVLCLLSLLVLPGCVAAVAGAYYHNDFIPVIVSAVVLTVAVLADLFGRREVFILLGRLKWRFRKSFHKEKYILRNGEVYHIQGNGPWRKLWDRLVPVLSGHSCHRIQLDINIPSRTEDFFGEWENIELRRSERFVAFTTSLIVGEKRVGTLKLSFSLEDRRRRDLLLYASEVGKLCEECIKQYYESGTAEEFLSTIPVEWPSEPDRNAFPKRAA